MHGKLCLPFVPPDQTRSCHDVISIDTFLAHIIPDWERRHTAQPPDSRSAAIHRIARGLIRSLDLNLWPGVRQGQGQGRRGWDRWRSLRRSSLPSNIPTDITTLELINFYIDTSGKLRVQLSYWFKRVWIVDTALRMLRCRNLELLETLLPSLACQ